jgi:26S proteasome regulatory subunit N9
MTALAYLDEIVPKVPEELSSRVAKLKELYSRKLWHQITAEMLALITFENFLQSISIEELYLRFISDFDHRIDCLSLCRLMFVVCEKAYERDPSSAIQYAEKTQKKVTASVEAVMLAKLILANLLMKEGQFPGARKHLEDVEAGLLDREGVSLVHQYFYELNCLYLEKQGDYAALYRDALRYLGCVDVSKLTSHERIGWAKRLAASSLLGKDVYNFGELLLSNILKDLESTEDAFLVQMVEAFNQGSLKDFENLSVHWRRVPELQNNETFLRRKIVLLCLMEMVFHRPPNQRTFTFHEVAQSTLLPVEEVEALIIHALSKGLLKGRIDEVDKKVNFTWLKPRVLDMRQIASMTCRFKDLVVAAADTTKEANDQMQNRWDVALETKAAQNWG